MPDYVSGLDIGQVTEHSALAVLEKETRHDGTGVYSLRHLERFELHTKYPDIVAAVKALCARPPLAGSALVVDLTGVGKPVLKLLYAAEINASLIRIAMTAGTKAVQDDDNTWLVPKTELVSALQILLQSGRLLIARELKHAKTLEKELMSFRTKVTLQGTEPSAAWREGPHDDLVLAVAIAVWMGENHFIGAWDPTPNPAARMEMLRAPHWVSPDDDDDGYDDDYPAWGR
jgi:hypothetical protein